MKRPALEYWVMRVLLHEGRPAQLDLMAPGVRIACEASINAGTVAMLPDGSIVEPIEVFDAEQLAHDHQAQLKAQFPDDDFRVVISADISV